MVLQRGLMGGKVIDARELLRGCRCNPEADMWDLRRRQRCCGAVSLARFDERPWLERLAILLKETDGELDWGIRNLDKELPGLDEARRQILGVLERSRALANWTRNSVRAYQRLMLLRSLWVRSPLDWVEDELSTGRSMARHLLASYPVPLALLSSFEDSQGHTSGLWIAWVVLMGRGVSLPKVGARFNWQIPARLPGLLFEAPHHLTAEQAVTWAEVRRLGGSASLANLFVSSGWIPRDAWDRRVDPLSWDALDQTVSWLVHNGEALDGRQVQIVMEWARHHHSEANAEQGRVVSWHRRTVASVLAHAEAYQLLLEQSGGGRDTRIWPPRGWDGEMSGDGITWVVRELCSASELAEEGHAMRHCVASYVERCTSGSSAVFSVSRNGVRVATVEVDPATMWLRQAKGPQNRSCDALEMELIGRWLDSISAVANCRKRTMAITENGRRRSPETDDDWEEHIIDRFR